MVFVYGKSFFEVLWNRQIVFEPGRSEKCFCNEQVSSHMQLYIVFLVHLGCSIIERCILADNCLLLTLNSIFSKLIP